MLSDELFLVALDERMYLITRLDHLILQDRIDVVQQQLISIEIAHLRQ